MMIFYKEHALGKRLSWQRYQRHCLKWLPGLHFSEIKTLYVHPRAPIPLHPGSAAELAFNKNNNLIGEDAQTLKRTHKPGYKWCYEHFFKAWHNFSYFPQILIECSDCLTRPIWPHQGLYLLITQTWLLFTALWHCLVSLFFIGLVVFCFVLLFSFFWARVPVSSWNLLCRPDWSWTPISLPLPPGFRD